MASYEATNISRDVNGACGLRFAPNQQLYSQFGRSPHCRCGRAPPSGICLKWQQWMKWHSARSVSSVEMLMEPVGWGLPQFNKFSRSGRSPHGRHGTALPSGIHLNWLQMDEMAWCETSIIFENVNGESELGFAQIKQFFHDFSTVAVVLSAPALPSRLCRNWPRMDEMA